MNPDYRNPRTARVNRRLPNLGPDPQVPEKETCHREVGHVGGKAKRSIGAIPVDQIKATLFDTEAKAQIVPAADPAQIIRNAFPCRTNAATGFSLQPKNPATDTLSIDFGSVWKMFCTPKSATLGAEGAGPREDFSRQCVMLTSLSGFGRKM
jgi:hypothetical protein